MNWRNTILLAAAVLVVLAIAYRDVVTTDPDAGWQVVFDEPEPTPPGADVERLVEFDPRTIKAVHIERHGRAVSVERTAYGWRHAQRPRAVRDLLDSVAAMAVILVVEGEPSAEDLEAYGLAAPQATIRMERDAAAAIEVRLGSHNPSATGIYAHTNQRPEVVLTGAVTIWDIEKALGALAAATAD